MASSAGPGLREAVHVQQVLRERPSTHARSGDGWAAPAAPPAAARPARRGRRAGASGPAARAAARPAAAAAPSTSAMAWRTSPQPRPGRRPHRPLGAQRASAWSMPARASASGTRSHSLSALQRSRARRRRTPPRPRPPPRGWRSGAGAGRRRPPSGRPAAPLRLPAGPRLDAGFQGAGQRGVQPDPLASAAARRRPPRPAAHGGTHTFATMGSSSCWSTASSSLPAAAGRPGRRRRPAAAGWRPGRPRHPQQPLGTAAEPHHPGQQHLLEVGRQHPRSPRAPAPRRRTAASERVDVVHQPGRRVGAQQAGQLLGQLGAGEAGGAAAAARGGCGSARAAAVAAGAAGSSSLRKVSTSSTGWARR